MAPVDDLVEPPWTACGPMIRNACSIPVRFTGPCRGSAQCQGHRRGLECITLSVPPDHFADAGTTTEVTLATKRQTAKGPGRGLFVLRPGARVRPASSRPCAIATAPRRRSSRMTTWCSSTSGAPSSRATRVRMRPTRSIGPGRRGATPDRDAASVARSCTLRSARVRSQARWLFLVARVGPDGPRDSSTPTTTRSRSMSRSQAQR